MVNRIVKRSLAFFFFTIITLFVIGSFLILILHLAGIPIPIVSLYVPVTETFIIVVAFLFFMTLLFRDFFRTNRYIEQTSQHYDDLEANATTTNVIEFCNLIEPCPICMLSSDQHTSHHKGYTNTSPKISMGVKCSKCNKRVCLTCTLKIALTESKCPFCREMMNL